MVLTERGEIRGGTIHFAKPLSLPDGTEVEVRIEPLPEVKPATPSKPEDFAALPFFGMWTDREDIPDSTAWVQQERQKWHQRVFRQE